MIKKIFFTILLIGLIPLTGCAGYKPIFSSNNLDFTITEYAKKILDVILPNRKIRIKYDLSKPNGTPRKVLDVSLAKKYGWKPDLPDHRDSILKFNDFKNISNLPEKIDLREKCPPIYISVSA